ncbi:hypothetical protein P8452_08695 [Trifolium repens]|nr:hypothetical protein P8452_08695 [Trifolium repens]
MNKAGCIKLCWKLLKSDKQWATTLRSRYFRNPNPITHVVSSSIWSSLKGHLPLIQNHSIWRVGDGTTISFWQDNWLGYKLKDSIDGQLPDSISHLMAAKVADVVNNQAWALPDDFRQKFPNIANDIQAMPISYALEPDELVWNDSPSGELDFKNAYFCGLPALQTPGWAKIIWRLFIPPSRSLVMWRIMHNVIATDDNMVKRGFPIVSCCSRYGREYETADHLFLPCPFITRYWNWLSALIGRTVDTSNSSLLGMCSRGWSPQAEEYFDHYRGCIRIYNGAVQTLERRIAEESGGTSAKQHAISQEQKGVEIAETEEPETKGEDDESEDGESEDGESEDSESDDAGGNSDVERVNNDANEAENDENDDESDENEDAKTISAEPRGVEVAESKEAEAETESGAGAETEVGESSDAQRFNNDQNEDDEEVEINAELLDESVKAACNVGLTLIQETIEKFPQYFDGGETENAELNKIDSENKDSGSQAMDTVTQETILKFLQFFNSDLNKTDSVSQESDSVTAETILKYPEFFDAGEASTGTECSQSLALILYEAPPTVKHEDKSDPDICIDATPLRS